MEEDGREEMGGRIVVMGGGWNGERWIWKFGDVGIWFLDVLKSTLEIFMDRMFIEAKAFFLYWYFYVWFRWGINFGNDEKSRF